MFDEALIDLNQAINLNSDDSDLFFNRSIALLKLLLYAEAEADCKKALELNPESSEIYSHLGNINFKLNKFDTALSFYDKAISLDPESHEALFSKGMFLKKIKRLDLAKIVYLRLLDFSENTDVTNDASLFFLNQKFFSIGWDAYAKRINTPLPIWKSFLYLTNLLSKYSLKFFMVWVCWFWCF
jgi:tetratricopeptide (TPR) repeat protein